MGNFFFKQNQNRGRELWQGALNGKALWLSELKVTAGADTLPNLFPQAKDIHRERVKKIKMAAIIMQPKPCSGE